MLQESTILKEKSDTEANKKATAGTKDETQNILYRAEVTLPEEHDVFMVHTKEEIFNQWNTSNSIGNWLVDSGATTHGAMNTKNITNIRIATEGQYVRVGNNATMPATVIGDLLTLYQGETDKKIFLKDVMVVPNFAKNHISVGRLTENRNTFKSNKNGA
jgi:hypothetical protein